MHYSIIVLWTVSILSVYEVGNMKDFELPEGFTVESKNLCGYRVRLMREQTRNAKGRKMTQTELAAQLQCEGIECDRLAICRIETGLRAVADYELVALAKVLKVPVLWLLYGNNAPEDV